MKVVIKKARLSFADIFKAKSIKGGKPRFSANFLCSEDTTIVVEGKSYGHEHFEEVIKDVCRAKFNKVPKKFKNWVYNQADGTAPVGKARDPFTDKEGEYWEGVEEDTFYVSAAKREDKAKNGQIPILDQGKQPIAENSGKIFSGCYVNAIVDVYAMDDDEGPLVSASLEGIQLVKTGPALGFTAIDAEDEFDEEEYEDIEADDDDEEDIPL